MLESLAQDLRFAARSLRRSPGFTLVATLTLALGVGANTAIFSVVDAVLLRPLPFADASRLTRVLHVPPAKSFPGLKTFSVSPANYLDWQAQNHVFERMAIYRGGSASLTGRGISPSQRARSSSVPASCHQERSAATGRLPGCIRPTERAAHAFHTHLRRRSGGSSHCDGLGK